MSRHNCLAFSVCLFTNSIYIFQPLLFIAYVYNINCRKILFIIGKTKTCRLHSLRKVHPPWLYSYINTRTHVSLTTISSNISGDLYVRPLHIRNNPLNNGSERVCGTERQVYGTRHSFSLPIIMVLLVVVIV